MNLNYKKFPLLKIISDLKKKGYTRYFASKEFVNAANERRVYFNEDNVTNQIGTYEILYFAENIEKKIFHQEFKFLKNVKPFFEQDLTDKGVIITQQNCDYIYDIKKEGDKHLINLSITTIMNDSVFVLGNWKGEVFIEGDNMVFDGDIILNKFLVESAKEEPEQEKSLKLYKEAFPVQTIFNQVIFKRYAPIEVKNIIANKSLQSLRKQTRKSKVKPDLKVTYINSTWFTKIVRSEGFSVKGHFRLQACGEGRRERKLIWINEFEKLGRISKARKTKL